ncbi:MAG: hypothetical protein RLY35_1796 [Bacteroidota bacterium]|jgi:hypothetical protein
MKTKIPTVAFIVWAIGAFFKMEHWPGANILLLLSGLLIMISTMIEFTQLEKDSKIRSLQIVVGVMVIACILGAIFKIFHWPGANFIVRVAMNVTIPAAIVFFFFGNKEYRLSRNLVAGIFYLLLLLMIFFPGNPIGEKVHEEHLENIQHQNPSQDGSH